MSEVKNYTVAALNVRGLRTQFMQVLIFFMRFMQFYAGFMQLCELCVSLIN